MSRTIHAVKVEALAVTVRISIASDAITELSPGEALQLAEALVDAAIAATPATKQARP